MARRPLIAPAVRHSALRSDPQARGRNLLRSGRCSRRQAEDGLHGEVRGRQQEGSRSGVGLKLVGLELVMGSRGDWRQARRALSRRSIAAISTLTVTIMGSWPAAPGR
jgi:hypothetical protein